MLIDKYEFFLVTVAIIVNIVCWWNVVTHEMENYSSIRRYIMDSRKLGNKDKLTAIFLKNTRCPVLSIRSQRNNDSVDTNQYAAHCRPWDQTEEVCRVARKFYSKEKDIHCAGKKSQTSNKVICKFVFSKRPRDRSPKVYCDKQICRSGRLFVGSVNPKMGIVTSHDWKQFRSAKSAELALPTIVLNNVRKGFRFCLLRCVKVDENIDQLLTFPHLLKRFREKRHALSKGNVQNKQTKRRGEVGKKNKSFNINIVVLDSVSRNHFYRMLTKTGNALRQIAATPDVNVLDYEFLQSLAPYTYTNVKALFMGSVEKNSHVRYIGVDKFYGHFKRQSYRTLFQEDSCWFDNWGTLLENIIKKDHPPETMKDFRTSWKNFRKLTKRYKIDDYGLTHFTCLMFTMYGISNMFNEPLKLCFGEKPFSSHFFRYVRDSFSEKHKRNDSRPIFSYLHSNFGHEVTGLRIKALDETLSIFLKDMARHKDTLTIVLSDHGPKTTTFSQDYLHGRYETYDSLLFMIIPKKIRDAFGRVRMSALKKNQKSLVTTLDVHAMLIEITQLDKQENNGLFSDGISNRTCDSLPMVSFGVCKCKDWEQIFIDQSPHFIWLAEFATDILNKKISEEFVKSLSRNFSNDDGLHFGKCSKLRLHRIWNIRQKVSLNHFITTFDLVVQPFYTVFLIQTKHSGKYNVELQSWRRVSIYRQYEKCKDKAVDIELCVCNRRKSYSNKNLLRIIKKAKASKDNKVIKTRSSCLYILLTTVQDKMKWIHSYDVINICAKRYIFALDTPSNEEELQTSRTDKTIEKELQPNTATFLVSVVVNENQKPTIKYYFRQF